jgi:hypothetical protein
MKSERNTIDFLWKGIEVLYFPSRTHCLSIYYLTPTWKKNELTLPPLLVWRVVVVQHSIVSLVCASNKADLLLSFYYSLEHWKCLVFALNSLCSFILIMCLLCLERSSRLLSWLGRRILYCFAVKRRTVIVELFPEVTQHTHNIYFIERVDKKKKSLLTRRWREGRMNLCTVLLL